MTRSAFTVAVLVAWPAVNILLGGYAAWLATAGDRRRRARAARAAGASGGAPYGAPAVAAGSDDEWPDDGEPEGTWWESLWSGGAGAGGTGTAVIAADRRASDRTVTGGAAVCGDATGGAALAGAAVGGPVPGWSAVEHEATEDGPVTGTASDVVAVAEAGDATPTDFWIVVPCLNEERVVGRTVRSALALAAPGAVSRVLAVDDASDDGTPEVLAGIDNSRLHVLRREFPDARRGKGEALNAAYAYIVRWTERYGLDPRRVVIGVIDGDGRGSDNLLAEVADALADQRIGAVQARVRIHNRNRLLGAVQDLEFGCVADASQMLRNRIGSVGLGGNGQFTRLSTLLSLGPAPWSDCLVEDLELGLRLHLAGIGIGYVWRGCITQQGVVDVRRLLRQRTRWAQGNLQCVRYLPRLAGAPSIRLHTFLEMSYYLLAPWLNALSSVLIAGLCGYALVLLAGGGAPVGGISPALGVAVWLSALLAPGLSWAVLHRLRLRDERWSRCLLAGLLYPGLLLLGLVSTWRAVARQVLGRKGWAKTERLAEEPALPDAGPVRLPEESATALAN